MGAKKCLFGKDPVMSIPQMTGVVFLLCGLVYAFVLGRELVMNKDALRQAPGDLKLIGVLEFFIFFVCTIGVSDFLLNTLMIKKLKLSDDKGIPSCLIASTLVPGAFIAFSYLQSEKSADALTLLLFMLCLAVGAVFGGRAVNRMNGAAIRKIMGFALLFSMAALIVKMIVGAGVTGSAVGLRGVRLIVMCAGCAVIGFINMMGVPCKPIAVTMLLLLGLSPVAALTLTIVLGVIVPMSGGVSIVRGGLYNRKMVLAAMTAGSAAAVLGVMLAISMDQLLLNILLIIVMLIAVISIFKK